MHPLTQKIIDRSPERVRPAVTLLARTADGAVADRLPGLAAELAFWVLLSLPALLLTAIAAISFVAGEGGGWEERVVDRILQIARVALSPDAVDNVLRPVLEQLIGGTNLSVVSIGFVATIWTASRAVKVVLVTIAITYGQDQPGGVADRILGLVLTLVGLLVGLVLAPLLIAGPGFGDRLLNLRGIGSTVLAEAWRLAYWPTAAIVVTALLASLYHVGAPWHTRWLRDLPGAILAMTGWLAGSAALRLYGSWILGSDSPYGPLAGPIVGLLWLWLTAFAVLVGAELNAQVEQRWPTHHGDDPRRQGRLRRAVASAMSRLQPS